MGAPVLPAVSHEDAWESVFGALQWRDPRRRFDAWLDRKPRESDIWSLSYWAEFSPPVACGVSPLPRWTNTSTTWADGKPVRSQTSVVMW